VGTGIEGRWIFIPIWLDPLRLPVRSLQQTHFPPARLTPGRGAIIAIPNAYLPGAALAGAQRGSTVGDMQRLIREHLSTVPQLTLMISHLDLVSRLSCTTQIGSELPAQARLFALNPQWIELIVTTKILNAKRRRRDHMHCFHPPIP